MKVSNKQIEQLVHHVFEELKSQGQITFKVKEDVAFRRAVEAVHENFEQEKQLDEEVNAMMDDLEIQHAGEFQRYKMFPMLKKKLAKEKGFVL